MKVTYDRLVDEIRELRLARDQADARLLLRLVEIERDHMDVLRHGGCTSFAQFCQDIVLPARYEAFKAGLSKVGSDEALAMGSDATIVAGKAQSQTGARKYVAAVRAWVADHGGTKPTLQTAREILSKRDPRESETQSEKRQDELARLRAENSELRAKLRAAEAELSKLRKQAVSGKTKKAA